MNVPFLETRKTTKGKDTNEKKKNNNNTRRNSLYNTKRASKKENKLSLRYILVERRDESWPGPRIESFHKISVFCGP